jgi:hypothetical protein
VRRTSLLAVQQAARLAELTEQHRIPLRVATALEPSTQAALVYALNDSVGAASPAAHRPPRSFKPKSFAKPATAPGSGGPPPPLSAPVATALGKPPYSTLYKQGKTSAERAHAAAAFLRSMRKACMLTNCCYDCGAQGTLSSSCPHRSAVLHHFGANVAAVKALLRQGA